MVLYDDLNDYKAKIKDRLIDTETKIKLIVDELEKEQVKIEEYIKADRNVSDRNVSDINEIFNTIEIKNNKLYEKITNNLSVKFPIKKEPVLSRASQVSLIQDEGKKILQFIELSFSYAHLYNMLDDNMDLNDSVHKEYENEKKMIPIKSVDGLKVFVCVEFPKNNDKNFYTKDIKTDVIGFIVNPEDEYNPEYENPVVVFNQPYFKDILHDIVTKMKIDESPTKGGKSRKKQTRINKNRSKKIYLKK